MSYRDGSRRVKDRDHLDYSPNYAYNSSRRNIDDDGLTDPSRRGRPRLLPSYPSSPRLHHVNGKSNNVTRHRTTSHVLPNSSSSSASPLRPHSSSSSPLSSSSSSHAAKAAAKIPGTDFTTGINSHDSSFTKLLYHSDYTREATASRKVNPKKCYKKPNKQSKKFPFKLLPRSKFIFDKDSLSPPPPDELVVWDLPLSVSESYLGNFIAGFGEPIKNMKFHSDPINAVPLGIATFKFRGPPEKALRLAKHLIKQVKLERAKVDGNELKISLNDRERTLLLQKISIAQKRLEAVRLQNIRESEEKKRQREMAERQLQTDKVARAEKALVAIERKSSLAARASTIYSKSAAALSSTNSRTDLVPGLQKYSLGTTTLSMKHNSKVVRGVFLPMDLEKYIKNRPYLLIYNKYVPTRISLASDIKRKLNDYGWTRVLSDLEGYFIVFKSLKECVRCFLKEDGKPLLDHHMHMELAVPEAFVPSEKDMVGVGLETKLNIVEEATNILIKDFQSFLAKDIRERVIAPAILNLLSSDKYPELYNELKLAEKEMSKPVSTIVGLNKLKEEALQRLAKQREEQLAARTSNKKGVASKPFRKKQLIPMQHALNFDNTSGDEEEDEDDDDEEEEQESDENKGRSRSKVVTAKRSRSPSSTAPLDPTDHLDAKKRKKQGRTIMPDFMYNGLSEEEGGSEAINEAGPHVRKIDHEPLESNVEEVDKVVASDSKYLPTADFPMTVYPETNTGALLYSLQWLQNMIKDEEDMRLAASILQPEKSPTTAMPNIEYWAWKQHQAEATNRPANEALGQVPQRLESSTGSFRTEGYRKIADVDKTQYIPHRRQINQPIKTVQYEDDDIETVAPAARAAGPAVDLTANNGNNGAVNSTLMSHSNSNGLSSANPKSNPAIAHSSRVNRANNRRFAADITAQLGTETEVLLLNTLTKRKKLVSFARSAIHNWGLYALEPIMAKEMIIEYVGESVRQQVADHREKSYLKTGIGSSYLFRIDETTVIDATKKGGIARFINHCCEPSCTAKIIRVGNTKRIVIYALRDIEANEELTYDYKFERETNDEERIRCLCGAASCKGYLN